jgi:hypothetical protein
MVLVALIVRCGMLFFFVHHDNYFMIAPSVHCQRTACIDRQQWSTTSKVVKLISSHMLVS